MNAALASNVENKKPVRVIRGYKLPGRYAPEEGYRYDGTYLDPNKGNRFLIHKKIPTSVLQY